MIYKEKGNTPDIKFGNIIKINSDKDRFLLRDLIGFLVHEMKHLEQIDYAWGFGYYTNMYKYLENETEAFEEQVYFLSRITKTNVEIWRKKYHPHKGYIIIDKVILIISTIWMIVLIKTLKRAWKKENKKRIFRKSDTNVDKNASSTLKTEWNTGGINFNPATLDLQIKRDANWVPLPMDQQPIFDMKIDGFSPVIINVVPVNVPLLLGLQINACPDDEQGSADCMDGIDPIAKLDEEVVL